MGLMGTTHCVGMCGGIMGSLALSQSDHKKTYALCYHAGRILSYSLVGLLAGWLGQHLQQSFEQYYSQTVMRSVLAVMMILAGLYIAQWFRFLVYIEKLGAVIWRFLRPITKRLLPIKNHYQALGIGIFWGWLPCGLVYSALVFALSSQSSLQGAVNMLSFGLGTALVLLPVSLVFGVLQQYLQIKEIRWASGAAMIACGAWLLFMALEHTFVRLGIC